jgi:arsenate reductase
MPNVLFLCTGNSARSILAEVLLNHLGNGDWRGFSAGSNPVGRVNPHALTLLQAKGHDVSGLSSKRWDVFAGPDAPAMDLIVTVCDSAAGETCPVWPGHPLTAHWGMPDPAAASGDAAAIDAAFLATYAALQRRLSALIAVPLAELSPADARAAIDRIGNS